MTLSIRPAELDDLGQIAALLVADAKERESMRPGLWRLDPNALEKTRKTIQNAMEAETPPFRQQWLVAEVGGDLVGVTHSILLPVPPIYAGEFGPPGLIMEDCFVASAGPSETRAALLKAAEDDLTEAGAEVLLASSIEGGVWEAIYADHAYDPLTLYYARTRLRSDARHPEVHPATEEDVPAIVTSSAVHRSILDGLHHRFWTPHEEADARFGAWMRRSLTLEDRDMFVAGTEGGFGGYAISHPATPLHFPTPHDISGIGVIDDFFHNAFVDPEALGRNAEQAAALFVAAEVARARRGDHSVLVVCPAAWPSKRALLEELGYTNAITWHIKRAD